MDMGLNGRTVIVTGATGGLGRRIVRRFVDEGADVVATYRTSKDDAEAFGDKVLPVRYELGDPGSARDLVEAALAWKGRVDVLVNNAVWWGLASAPDGSGAYEDLAEETWLGIVRANIEGAIGLSRLVAPHFRQRKWGRLVHLSSGIAKDGLAGAEYYGAAKAALHGFSRSAARSLGRDGDILSNVVSPGLTKTDTNGHIVEAAGEVFAGMTSLGRLLTADELAVPIVYLASAANTGITGQVIDVDAGV